MGKKEFENFLNRESKKEEKTVIWEDKLNRWKSFIDILYQNINKWLKEYKESGKVNIKTNDIEIYEEAIGKYSVQEMIVKIGNDLVKITPIGTVLIGTIGRVDIVGKRGTQKIILADKDATGLKIEFNEFTSEEERKRHDEKRKKSENKPVDWVWKLTSNPPSIKYSELNQESFFECLMTVMNG